MVKYRYIGDRNTDPALKNRECTAIRRQDGKCIRARNGSMLVEFDGIPTIVVGRLLRKIKSPADR